LMDGDVVLPVDVDPPLVEVGVDEVTVPVFGAAADPVEDSLDEVVLDVESAELVEDVPDVSAPANP